MRTFARRHRAGLAAAAVVLLTLMGATVYSVRQAREADRQRGLAERALARAEAVGEFYHFALADAGPPDAPLTIDGMIERSQSLLDTEFAGQPELQAAVLNVQASYYLGRGNAALGEPLATRAVDLAAHSADPDLIAGTACTRGFALTLRGQVEEGTGLVEEALAETRLSPATASSCHAQRAYIAQNRGDGATAERHATAALQALTRDSRRRPRSEALFIADLAYAQQLLGKIGDANANFAKALDQLTALDLEWTPVAGTILNNWGIAVLYAGDVKRALALWQRAADVLRARDPSAPLPAFLLGNLGRANEQSGRFDDALKLYERSENEARAAKRVDMVAYGLNGLATVEMQLGHLDRAERLLTDTRTVTDALPAGVPVRLNADVLAGRIALARGRAQEAWDALERLRIVYDAQPPGPGGASVRLFMADAAMALNRPDDAARVADEALTRARALQSGMPFSRTVGLAHFAVARADAARGRIADARRNCDAAIEHFTNAVAEDHPTVREMLDLQASLRPPASGNR